MEIHISQGHGIQTVERAGVRSVVQTLELKIKHYMQNIFSYLLFDKDMIILFLLFDRNTEVLTQIKPLGLKSLFKNCQSNKKVICFLYKKRNLVKILKTIKFFED